MKEKHFKKLRKKVSVYLVKRSWKMFGGISTELKDYTEVVARNPREAAQRYMKRTHALKDLSRWDEIPDESNDTFAKLRVVPKQTPFQRFVTYWR